MNPKLSIVTGTIDRPESFRRMFRSILRHGLVETEVIVVDASEFPYSQRVMDEELIEFGNGITHGHSIHEYPPTGVFKGYNIGFRECSGEYVIWLNDDAEVLPGWDKTAIDFMEDHPEVGIGCIYFADKKADGTWKSVISDEDKKRMVRKEITENEANREPIFEVQSLYGLAYANFGILKKEFGDEIGWFDETLGYSYGCDNAICNEAIIRGFAVVPIPDCRILHHRERDDARAEARPKCSNDRKLYDQKWAHHMDDLRKKMEKFSYLSQPNIIKASKADLLVYGTDESGEA